MSLQKKISARIKRRKQRVRNRINSDHPRISVFRSLNHIYAQIIEDKQGHTLASFSSLELFNKSEETAKKAKKEIAYEVGQELARRAQEKGIKKAVFDRGQFLYHGRVKRLAEGLREGGIEI